MAKMKFGAKLVIGLAVVGILGYGGNYLMDKTGIGTEKVAASVAPRADVGSANTLGGATAKINVAPVSNATPVKLLTIAWNGTMGLQYANGAATTAPGSIMAKRGVKLTIERQDDYSKMLEEQMLFAKDVKDGKPNPRGAAFVIIMGDGFPAYIAGAQDNIKKLDSQLQVIGAIGRSLGEDKCMLKPEAKADPGAARGSLIAGVLRDGDWNICVKWATDNDIAINPDEKTYDPAALNFIATKDFVEAGEKHISGYCETRPVVVKGKLTGEKRKVCLDGLATWTPGDVTAAKKKGGLVSIASTKEYKNQMATIIIGNKVWMEQNKALTENILAGAFEGSDAIRTDPSALMKGAEVSAAVYKEEDAAYWAKYFKGVTEPDKNGVPISLGGSAVMGLADAVNYFGVQGTDDTYKRVYDVFGGFTKYYYPNELPALINYSEVVNKTFLTALAGKSSMTESTENKFESAAGKTLSTFAKKSYAIEFETGKATFTPAAQETLDNLLNQTAVSGLYVQLNGHTDAVGNGASNLDLSKRRAEAVRNWLMANAASAFPAERVQVRAFGDTQPLADNTTAAGRAKNRRVEVLLKSAE
jgi:OmpA-OmpF porin, OOP family